MKICMVIVDCLRPDHLGCYGYQKPTSPRLDAIASQSAVFENVIAQANWTYPSVYSLFTGRYPSTLQLAWFDQQVSKSFPVLSDILARKGFRTGFFSNLKILLNRNGFSGHFHESRFTQLSDNVPELVKSWQNNHKDSFLLVHTAEYIHEPFFAPQELVELFLDDESRKIAKSPSKSIRTLVSRSSTGNSIRQVLSSINQRISRPSGAEVKYLLACYDAGIRYVDRIVGELHDTVSSCGDDYLFIVTADHGQAFMEHKVIGHGFHLYDELIKVPLMVDFNGRYRKNIRQTVQLMDLFPTILDALNVQRDFPIDAVSFAPLLEERTGGERFALSEGYPFVSLRDDTHKLISTYNTFENHKELLRYLFSHHLMNSWKRKLLARVLSYRADRFFNIVRDPHEKVNIQKTEHKAWRKQRIVLEEILEKSRKDSFRSTDVGFDNEMRRQLEGLGYL